MDNKNYNFRLAEEMVVSTEDDLKDAIHNSSNQIYKKLNNILKIFKDEKVSTNHFNLSTGSGHGDISREKIDDVFAKFFVAEKAAVRMQFVSGTHAISSVLFGILRPGDLMLSVTGSPYDTLEEVIGIRGKGKGSLLDLGIKYKQISFDEEKNSLPISDDALKFVASQINSKDQVIISDYDKGLLPFLGDFLYTLKQKQVETYVDPKGSDFGKYKNCFMIKPNIKELRTATLENPEMDIDDKVWLSMQKARADVCLLTKSSDGMSLYSANKKQDFDIISSEVYEDLSKSNESDRYEFIYPNIQFTKDLFPPEMSSSLSLKTDCQSL